MKTMTKLMTWMMIFILSGSASLFASSSIPVDGKNPEVVKETRTVPAFTGVRVGGAFEVIVKQTGSCSVVIEADNELIEYITTEVSGNILRIGMKNPPPKCWNNSHVLRAYITVDKLESLDLSGAVEFTTESLIKGNELKVDISGAVEADFNLDLTKLYIELSGASEIELTGQADVAVFEASGASEIDALDFVVQELSIYASGATDARVHAEKNLKISASGACDVSYTGNASVDAHTSGASDVRKVK